MDAEALTDRPARRRPGRPRGQDSAVVREAALRAAIDLIARQGFAATSMAQVAEAAGISPSGLAHHFRSKKALLGAVLEHRDAMDSLPLDDEAGGPWGAFTGLVEIARRNMQRRQLVLLYMTMIGEAITPQHPAHGWMVHHYSDAMATLVGQLEAGQRDGFVREDAPREQIARQTIALMDGLQVQWLLDPTVDMAEAMAEHTADLRRRWGREGSAS